MGNLFIQVCWFLLHPFYVSITTVDYNKEAQRVEISCRIFYDDFETALKKTENVSSIDLINPPNKTEVDSLISRYLRRHLHLAVDGHPRNLHYIGYEIEEDVTWCYLEADEVASLQQITIDNQVLYGQFPKQSNILHVTAYGERKSTKLDNPEHRAAFTFTQNPPR